MSLKDKDWMGLAWVFSRYGTCSRRQVGAVLVKDKRILTHGYNGSPAGVPHCVHDSLEDSEGAPQGCITSVHAEMNTIAHAAKHGLAVEGSSLYTTDEPCFSCSQAIIAAGIKEVIYDREYRNHTGLALLRAAGVAITPGSEL